jgi:hypothetical protein
MIFASVCINLMSLPIFKAGLGTVDNNEYCSKSGHEDSVHVKDGSSGKTY